MPAPIRPPDVVVGFLTENAPRMLTQAIRLLRSIRWFGGELAAARVVVCGVGPLESRARETLESLGAEVRTVTRFHPTNPTGNRNQLFAELLDAPQKLLLVLDCDTIIVQDPLPFLIDDVFQAKITPTPTVSDEVFERLFAHFSLSKPPRSYVTGLSGTPTVPYFNSGVIAIPTSMARILAPVWRRYNLALAEQPQLAAPCQRHMHQASLALALAETGVPCVQLPEALNYQINTQHLAQPPGFVEIDPVIIHYHQLASEDGFLLPCIYPPAQARIEAFHSRMRAEGFAPESNEPRGRESPPVVVAGMHRSGTSLVAELLNAMGIYAGEPGDLAPPDIFNPTGYWEHRVAAEINREILATLGASWKNVTPIALTTLSNDFVSRAKDVAHSVHGRGPFLIKDPRISLLFPIWREALPGAIIVIPWREPMAVAHSVANRDRLPLLSSIALWEHYNRTLLRDTEGLPRLLVSYEELLADPVRMVRSLHDALAGFGIEGLTLPSEQHIRQIVNPDFNRSGTSRDNSLLDPDQGSLLDGLRSGSVLHDRVAPSSPRTLEVLAVLGEMENLEKALRSTRQRATILDQLLAEVFASRSWRLGNSVTGLLRMLRRVKAVSAEERWRDLS
ncbi:MAG TPA: sulfotransferase [Thermoanaerobaculia bacterium]|jgi:hypothetical protein|nr:sulfotransferase [Thermoanaerobaculia bacterium]